MDVRVRIGRNMKKLRKAKGWSQEELADQADIHRTYISGVERGLRNPTATVLEKLAVALGAKASALLD